MSEQENIVQEYIDLLAHEPAIQTWILDYALIPYDPEFDDIWERAPLNLPSSSLKMLLGFSKEQLEELLKAETEEEENKIGQEADHNALYFQEEAIFDLFIQHLLTNCLNLINKTNHH